MTTFREDAGEMVLNGERHPFLRVVGLDKTYANGNGGLDALCGVNLELYPREFVSLLGPSGSGKSTLLRILAGLIQPSSGEVMFNPAGAQVEPGERPLTSLVFQDANLMPWRSVRENIALPLLLSGVPRPEALAKASEWIELVGLEGFANSWPRDLSGGMAQRVAIARALIQDPGLLLLDEPFGALDALTREKMAAELLRLWQDRRTTVLMVTHSISEALLLSDRVLVFSSRPGSVVLDLNVTLPRPREEGVRYTPEFGELARALKRAIS
jgi:NitT/TauT family transport system ATP-binding protein